MQKHLDVPCKTFVKTPNKNSDVKQPCRREQEAQKVVQQMGIFIFTQAVFTDMKRKHRAELLYTIMGWVLHDGEQFV